MSGPYRDGHIHVLERQCDTCIFRPGNLYCGRLDRLTREAIAADTAIICHSTLSDDQAVCRGFFDRHHTLPLRMAEALNLIRFDSAEGRHP